MITGGGGPIRPRPIFSPAESFPRYANRITRLDTRPELRYGIESSGRRPGTALPLPLGPGQSGSVIGRCRSARFGRQSPALSQEKS